MYRTPVKNAASVYDGDLEQQTQAYDQGYEANRQGKPYINPWRKTNQAYDINGYAKNDNKTWEDELNLCYYYGFYDYTLQDWVPYLTDEQQSDYAVNPKTGKVRRYSKDAKLPIDLNYLTSKVTLV